MPLFNQKKTWPSHMVRQSPAVVRFTSGIIGPEDQKYKVGQDDETGYEYRMRWFETRDDSPEGTYLVLDNPRFTQNIEEIPQGKWVRLSLKAGPEGREVEYEPLKAAEGVSKGQTATGEGSYKYPSAVDRYTACLRAAERVAENTNISKEENPEIYWEFVRNVATHFSMDFARGDTAPNLTPEDAQESEEEDAVEDSTSHAERVKDLVEEIGKWEGEAHDGSDLGSIFEGVMKSVENDFQDTDTDALANWLEAELTHQQEIAMGGEDDLPF